MARKNAKPAPAVVAAPSSAMLQRIALCFGVALLMHWTTDGGLFLHASDAFSAVVVGLAAGLVGSVWMAGACAGLAVFIGGFSGPFSVWFPGQGGFSAQYLLWVMLAAIVGAGVAWIVSRRLFDPRWLVALTVAIMVANMWWTVIEIDATPIFDVRTNLNIPALYKVIDGESTGVLRESDGYLYSWVRAKMRSGTGYYAAFAAARPAIVPGSAGPTSVLNIREPLLYEAFAAAPNPWLIIVALLTLGTISALCVFPLLREVVKMPLALPGVAAVLTYTIPIATTTTLLFAEAWAGMLCLIALTLHVVSLRSPSWKRYVVAAAATGLLALLIRELAAAVLVGGLVSAWFSAGEQRRFRLTAWGVALGAGVLAFVAHAIAAIPHLAHPAAGAVAEGFGFFKGGLAFALAAFTYDTHPFAYPFELLEAIPTLLALLGLVGLFLLPRFQTRVLAATTIGLLILADFVAGNSAWGVGTTASVNYWGMLMLFTLYACLPAVFALVPAARPRVAATDTDRR